LRLHRTNIAPKLRTDRESAGNFALDAVSATKMGAMASINPFRIAVSDDDLDDLRSRLSRTRWPEAECVDDWSQGIPLAYTRELAAYWETDYDWRAREAALNRFDHFTTEIDGLDIHFIHQRSPQANAFPLIITHGWPGSIVEFHKVIEPLTEHGFDVVCPSLPGYGFSGKPSRTGWGIERIATAWDTLMDRLGYARYGAQGGDWGAAVTTQIGRNGGHPSRSGGGCAAIHLNMPLAFPPGKLENPTEEEKRALERGEYYQQWDSGYMKEQSTRPQTVGYGLVDSPVGQLAWIVEKFWSWTDCDGHPENVLTRDELLDNVMMYWLTASGASSGRLYWESFNNFGKFDRVEVPTGVASFPKEIMQAPRNWCEAGYNIAHWTTMPRGGHFAAFEQPDLYVEDVRAFFDTVR
jgi:pimeloyl-ACP methyl ester carboxylesterase